MRPGLLTAPLSDWPLDEVASFAASAGFEALEVTAWPKPPSHSDYAPRHIEAESLDERGAEEIRGLLDRHGLAISALACYENNLHPDAGTRARFNTHLYRVIDAAALLGVDGVGTFVGAYPGKPSEVIREAGRLFRSVSAYAAERDVRIMIENCPMDNWVTFGRPGNVAYSPELWDALFEEVPASNFGLMLDPSHLHWLGIDPVQAVTDFGDRIFMAHAKDAEFLPGGRQRFGIKGEQLGSDIWSSGWWRYRLPGRGEVDWNGFIDALRRHTDVTDLSFEHEDPEYEGAEERVLEGLRLGADFLNRTL